MEVAGSGCPVRFISWVTENGESPVGAPFCSKKPEKSDFRDWEIKRERVKKSERERGVLPSHGTAQTTAG